MSIAWLAALIDEPFRHVSAGVRRNCCSYRSSW